MKNIIELIKKNKRVVISAVLIIVILIVIILSLSNRKTTITCSKNIEVLDGITLKETVDVSLKKKKAVSFKVNKTMELDAFYTKNDIYMKTLEQHFNGAYKYLNEKDYKVTKKDNSINAKVKTKDGIILNNINIILNESNKKGDISINSVSTLETSDTAIKANDEFSKKELKQYIEKSGYTCK